MLILKKRLITFPYVDIEEGKFNKQSIVILKTRELLFNSENCPGIVKIKIVYCKFSTFITS